MSTNYEIFSSHDDVNLLTSTEQVLPILVPRKPQFVSLSQEEVVHFIFSDFRQTRRTDGRSSLPSDGRTDDPPGPTVQREIMSSKQEFVEQSAQFLEDHEVYFLLRDLMKQLITHQPAEPLKFMIEKLQTPKPLVLCMVSPPSLVERNTIAGDLCKTLGLKQVNVGAELKGSLDPTQALAKDSDSIGVVEKALKVGSFCMCVLLTGSGGR